MTVPLGGRYSYLFLRFLWGCWSPLINMWFFCPLLKILFHDGPSIRHSRVSLVTDPVTVTVDRNCHCGAWYNIDTSQSIKTYSGFTLLKATKLWMTNEPFLFPFYVYLKQNRHLILKIQEIPHSGFDTTGPHDLYNLSEKTCKDNITLHCQNDQGLKMLTCMMTWWWMIELRMSCWASH